MAEEMEDGEGRSMREEGVGVSEGDHQGTEKQEDGSLSGTGLELEEDSSVERRQGVGREKLSDPEDPTIQDTVEDIEGIEEMAPTSESEVEHPREVLVPDDEEEVSASRVVDEPVLEATDSRGDSEDGDHPDSVSTNEQSPEVDEEGPTTQLEGEKENSESRVEGSQALPVIADGLSHPPDTGSEDVDSVDLLDLLDPKPLDFDVIDFDQFGPQPPDFPLCDNLDNEVVMKVNQYGGIDRPDGEKGAGESHEVTKPEDQITYTDVGIADSGVEQGMKTLNDGPAKSTLTDTSEKEQLQKERGPDMDSYHIVPNRIEELQLEDNLPSLSFEGAEDNVGHDVPRDLDSQPIPERNGTSEHQPPDTVNAENIGEASSDSALRSLNSETEVEGPPAPDEIQIRAEELNLLTQKQAKQLEDVRHQVQSSTAQLKEQSKIHDELKRDLETECNERLKSEAKLMVLNEILPNMEEKLKNLSNQVLFLEDQLQEQVDLRNKLEDDLQQERRERMQHDTQLEEQVDLKNKLAETLEQERKEKVQYNAQQEEQTRLHAELAHKLDEEQDGRLKSEADLKVLREMLSNAEEKLTDLHDQVESLVAQLQEQTELRKGLEGKLDWEGKERHMTKIEEQSKSHEELALKLEEERDERLKVETSLKELRESLSNKEKELKELRESLSNKEEELRDLQNQVLLLTTELQEQIERKKELEDKLDHEREQSMQDAGMVSDHSHESLPVSSLPWSEEKLEFAKLLDEQKTLLANQVLEAESLKNAAQMRVGSLNHHVQNLEMLTDIAESMEHAFSAKERALKQALWTVFQVVCLGLGFMHFVVACRDPLRTSLQPT